MIDCYGLNEIERGDKMNCGKQEQYERIEKLDMQLHKYQFRYIRHLIDEADLYKGDPRLIMTCLLYTSFLQDRNRLERYNFLYSG